MSDVEQAAETYIHALTNGADSHNLQKAFDALRGAHYRYNAAQYMNEVGPAEGAHNVD